VANYYRLLSVSDRSALVSFSNDHAIKKEKLEAVILALNMFISSKRAAAIDVWTTGSADIEPHYPRLSNPPSAILEPHHLRALKPA
jgi:hypothetical protein